MSKLKQKGSSPFYKFGISLVFLGVVSMVIALLVMNSFTLQAPKLAFVSKDESGTRQLFTIAVTGNDSPTRLTHFEHYQGINYYFVLPDGRFLIEIETNPNDDYNYHYTLYLVDPNTDEIFELFYCLQENTQCQLVGIPNHTLNPNEDLLVFYDGSKFILSKWREDSLLRNGSIVEIYDFDKTARRAVWRWLSDTELLYGTTDYQLRVYDTVTGETSSYTDNEPYRNWAYDEDRYYTQKVVTNDDEEQVVLTFQSASDPNWYYERELDLPNMEAIGGAYNAVWLTDSASLIYWYTKGNYWETDNEEMYTVINRLEIVTGNVTQLANFDNYSGFDYAFNPKYSLLAFGLHQQGEDENHPEIWLIDTNTGEATPLGIRGGHLRWVKGEM